MVENHNPKIAFGSRVRYLRKKLGWSQEHLALKSGLDRSYIGGVERGQRNISLENICLIAKALKAKPSRLLNFDPDDCGLDGEFRE